MAVEIPSLLIRQIQAILRREAGVPEYDPADPTLPVLTPAEEAIRGLDPSAPPYLRCKQCRAALLRGVQSIVCVFCGAEQRREGPPLSISFNTTLAYRKLLGALDLDGSELIASNTEAKDSGKGQGMENDGLVLSDLLDIELMWPYEREKVQSSSTNDAPMKTLNLSGVDLDNFFSETNKETSSNVQHVSDEMAWPEKGTGLENFSSFDDLRSSDKALDSMDAKASVESFGSFEVLRSSGKAVGSVETKPSAEDFVLFEDLHYSDKAVDSVEIKRSEFGDSFAVWEAEFQSASSQTSVTIPNPNEFYQDSSSSYYASEKVEQPLNIVSGMNREGEIAEFSSNASQLSSLNDNRPLDDLWHTADSVVSSTAEQFSGKSNADDGELKPNSLAHDWAQTDVWPTGSTSILSTNESMKPLDDWQDFTSSGNAAAALSSSWTQTSTGVTLSNEHESGNSSVSFTDRLEDIDFGSFIQSDVPPGLSDFKKDYDKMDMMQSETSVSGRMNEWDKMEINAHVTAANKNEIFSTKPPENVNAGIEALLSQMHDLSFMLEDNLSIPKMVGSSD